MEAYDKRNRRVIRLTHIKICCDVWNNYSQSERKWLHKTECFLQISLKILGRTQDHERFTIFTSSKFSNLKMNNKSLQVLRENFLCISYVYPSRYVPGPSRILRFHHRILIACGVQIKMALISPLSSYVLSLSTSSIHNAQSAFYTLWDRQCLTPIQNRYVI